MKINDYRNKILKRQWHVFIFAPNSSGKTLFAESLTSFKNDKSYHLIDSNSLESFLKDETKIQKSITNSSKNWNLEIQKLESESFLYENDISFINAFISIRVHNMQIQNTTKGRLYLKDLIIKKGHKKFKMNELHKLKKEISASEFELFRLMIFVSGVYNSKQNIVIDDPIEVSSWENERMFISFLECLFNKDSDTRIILLTHRISLYKKLIGLHRKSKSGDKKSAYFYFIDYFPFPVEKYDPTFLDLLPKNIIDKNEIVKRMHLEDLYSRIYFRKIGETKQEQTKNMIKENWILCSKESDNLKGLYKETTKAIKSISYEKLDFYNKTKVENMDLFGYISLKFLFINILRNSIIGDWNEYGEPKIKSLMKITKEREKYPHFFKKEKSDNQMSHLLKTLNDFLHKSEWILWNEVSIENIVEIIKRNFNLKIFKNTNKAIKKWMIIAELIKRKSELKK